MATTVVGVFDSADDARRAVSELQAAGFGTESIDHASRPAGYTTGAYASGSNIAPGGADAYTNTSGTMVEGAADAVDRGTSSIGRFFKNLFSDDTYEADRYTDVAAGSHSIVTVHADTEARAEQAADIMDRCGAINVDERGAQYGYDTTTRTRTDVNTAVSRYADYNTANRTAAPGETLKVVEENLQVGKREVETGGARLRARVVSRPVEESLRLREEHVFVNRTPVDRPATEADFNTFKEGTIEMRETAEVPVVNKEARVVEEVSLGKEVTEREEVVRDTVRKTEVDVEQIPGSANVNRDNIAGTNRNLDANGNPIV